MRALVDGDILVFRTGFACEKTAYYLSEASDSPNKHTFRFQYKKELDEAMKGLDPADYQLDVVRELEPLPNALHTIKLSVEGIRESLELDDDELTIVLSGVGNFRDHVATTRPYKGHRDPAQRPSHEAALKQYLKDNYDVIESYFEEADDVIGYTHYARYLEDDASSIIVTIDKDLNMLPGFHYDYVKNHRYYVGEEEAEYTFWKQLLTGDTTDNIVGVPKIGPRKAETLLNGAAYPNEWPEIVKGAYQNAYGDEWRDVMLEMGRLIWIRRYPEEMWEIPE